MTFVFLLSILTAFTAPLEVSHEVEGAYALSIPIPPLREPTRPLTPVQIRDPLIIMNTLGELGAVIAVSDPHTGWPKYQFRVTKIEANGYMLEGENTTFRKARIRVEINPETKAVVGWIRDASLPRDLPVLGENRHTTRGFYKPPQSKPLGLNYVEGEFTPPLYLKSQGTLFIKIWEATPELVWNSAFASPELGSAIHFAHTRVDLYRRSIEMVYEDRANENFLKWVFGHSITSATGEVTLSGFRFSTGAGITLGQMLVKKP